MIKRICPICDQIMSSAHYCSTCRRVVKDPWIRDVSYYLNERHPEDEANCSYHNHDVELDTSRDNVWDVITAKQNIQKRMADRAEQREAGGQAVWSLPGALTDIKRKKFQVKPNVPFKEQVEKKKLSPAKLALIIFVIFMVFQILTAVLAVLGSGLSALLGYRYSAKDPEIDLGEYIEGLVEGDGGSVKTLEEADVMAAGKACSAYKHFSVKGEDLQDEIETILKKNGYQIESQREFSYNEQYDDDETFFERVRTYDLETEKGKNTYQYLEINSDTATDDLHEINMFLADLKKSEAMTGDVRTLLERYAEVDVETYSHTDGYSVYITRE